MNKLYFKKLLVVLTMAVALATTTAPVNRAHAVTAFFTGGGGLSIILSYSMGGVGCSKKLAGECEY